MSETRKLHATLLFAFSMTTLLVVLSLQSAAQSSDQLGRQPNWGALIVPGDGPGAIVRRVEPGSTIERAGLRSGDMIININERDLTDPLTTRAILRSVRGGDEVTMKVARDAKQLDFRFTLAPLQQESIPGVDVRYESIVTERGHRLRTIVTKPKGSSGRLPAIMFVQWLSCDSIESPLKLTDGWSRILRAIAERSGMVLLRVERPGIGDSEGPDCSQSDLETDMAGFRAALGSLRRYDFVDSNRVFILGASIGAALAPVLAQTENVQGLIVSGGFAKTWFEHMMEIERNRLELTGRSAGEINSAMRGYALLYSGYLNERLTPAEVLRRHPELTSLWEDLPEHQYGRPAAFFHQVQQLNVESAWEKISAPVLVIYGEYDWIMSRSDHEHIIEIVNKRHPGNAKLFIGPKMDHDLNVYRSRSEAFRGEGGGFDDNVTRVILDWLASH